LALLLFGLFEISKDEGVGFERRESRSGWPLDDKHCETDHLFDVDAALDRPPNARLLRRQSRQS